LERGTEVTTYQRSLSKGALKFFYVDNYWSAGASPPHEQPCGCTPYNLKRWEQMKQEIAAQIKGSLTEGRLPCATAFKVARKLDVSPKQVGEVANELNVKISRCQLGLFGYGSNKGKSLEPAQEVGEELQARIEDRVIEGGLPCATAWDIARELTMKRIDVANAAESLGIRITQCQLGCF